MDLPEVEEAVGRVNIVGVGLLVELHVVTDDGGRKLRHLREVECLQDFVHMWH